jgi:hypothetical protein
MFFKNLLSRVGVDDACGVGVGVVCADALTAAIKTAKRRVATR